MTDRIAVGLHVGGVELELTIGVPSGPVRVVDLLPVFNKLNDTIVSLGVRDAELDGKTVSCRAGCGACCRQMVPITLPEAGRLASLVDALPEPRRSEIRARFERGVATLSRAGLLRQLRDLAAATPEERRQVGLDYFSQQVACPFLEDESCSIHPDRPMACRDYLVTSPASLCKSPSPDVEMVELPARVWSAVARLNQDAVRAGKLPWVPLLLALERASGQPDAAEPRPAGEILRAVFDQIASPPA